MDIRIQYCHSWGFHARATSYAADIRQAVNTPVELELIHKRGQFRVLVDGQVVLARRGGLLAKLLGKPWPAPEEVVAAVRAAIS